jgi:hypothetical protein
MCLTELDVQELVNVIKILGLQLGVKYDTPEARATLRYGKVMLMTDQVILIVAIAQSMLAHTGFFFF